MPNQKRRHWTNCWLAGLLGFFIVSSRRAGRDDKGERAKDGEAAAKTFSSSHTSETSSQNVSNTTVTDADSLNDESRNLMTSESDDNNRQSASNPLAGITVRQWIIAAALLIVVPVVVYLATFFLYPYAQDLLEGESPVDAVLAEYGVDEDVETQILTVRRGDLINSVAVNGTLEYANSERLSFGATGTIDTIEVEIGDFVSEGEILMSLETAAIVAAEQQRQSASVTLQEAEEKLDELIEPNDKALNDATLKVLKAHQTLADAEEALESILQPTDADITRAELDIAKAAAALDDASNKLSDLRNPADIDIENAKLAVAEAEKSLDQFIDELEELTNQKSLDIRTANLAVSEAVKAHDEAIENYQNILTIDQSAVDQSELDIAKAELAVIEADAAVDDAEEALHKATKNIENGITTKQLEIAQAESDLTSAKIAKDDAKDAYKDARKPFDEDEVDDLRVKIADTQEDLEVAEHQLKRLQIETEAETRKLRSDLDDARDTYQDVFFKWLGMDIAKYEWKMSPDEIFADIGKSIYQLIFAYSYPGGLAELGLESSRWVTDNPDTPWDEVVVATWNEFFPGQFRFDCAPTDTGINQVCINLEFDNAWDDLLLKTEAYETAMLANTQQFDNTEDAIETAKSKLEDLEEQLEDALIPTDEDTLADLFAKQETAYYAHIDAQNKVDTLHEELDRLQPELETRRQEASQALTVAQETAKVARNDLEDAKETLAEIKSGADDTDIAIAAAKVDKAEADLEDSRKKLEELQDTESPDVVVLNRRIGAAQADLQLKIDELDTLLNGDELEIALAETELASAKQELDDKITALEELVSPEQSDIELARQEVDVADTDLVAAEEELESLVNPDPATVALRRAEVATAREEFLTAIAATEGTQIIAPFDGIIADIPAEEGQTTNPKTAAIVIADPSIVEISGTVDEVDVLFLQVGDPASIELEALGDEALIGNISDIAAFGESNQGVVTYPVTIQTEQPADTQLPEGLSAVAEVVIREQTDQLLVPIQALFGSVNQPILLISKSDGTLEPRDVTLGISDDFWTVIEDGVSEGETILMTVVGADTSQFGGFRAISRSVSVSGGPPPGR